MVGWFVGWLVHLVWFGFYEYYKWALRNPSNYESRLKLSNFNQNKFIKDRKNPQLLDWHKHQNKLLLIIKS